MVNVFKYCLYCYWYYYYYFALSKTNDFGHVPQDGWLAGWLAGWLGGWLVGWLVAGGWVAARETSQPAKSRPGYFNFLNFFNFSIFLNQKLKVLLSKTKKINDF